MKLCKDCKHFQHSDDTQEPLCGHPGAVSFDDPVWGNHSRKSCHEMRINRHLCGRFGTLFANPPGFVAELIQT